ncbi:MAG: YitT family protein [Cyclobacteriaceae bacterium]|nr:YitT family protein [Cyclobacteriaceae bacterium]
MPTSQRHQQLQRLRLRRIDIIQNIKDAVLILMGVMAAGFGLKGFLLPNRFLDGGVMGISLLANVVWGIQLPLLVILFNLPFVVIAYTQVAKKFAIKTLIAISALAGVLALVEFPIMTHDKLLIAVFGGFFLGGGIGLSIRGGSVIDGTEVLAIFTSKKTTMTVGDVILILNIIIFSVAAYLINVETALYAILTYLVASKTVDFVVHGIEEYTSVMIVSDKHEEIKDTIITKLGRGVTVLKGKSGYGKKGHRVAEVDVIFSVVTRLELQRMKTEITKIDPEAFVVENSINDIKGGMIKKRPFRED